MPRKKRELASNSSGTHSEKESEALDSTISEKPLIYDADWLNQFISLPQDPQHSEVEFATMKEELKRTQEENRLLKEQLAVLHSEKVASNSQLAQLLRERNNAYKAFQKLNEQAKAVDGVAKDNKRIADVLQAQLQDQTNRMVSFFSLPIQPQLAELMRRHLSYGAPLNNLIVSLMEEIHLMLICDRAFILHNIPKEHVEFLLNQQKILIENSIIKLQELLTFVQNDLSTHSRSMHAPSTEDSDSVSVQSHATSTNESDSISVQSPSGSPALLPQFLTQASSIAKAAVVKKHEKPYTFMPSHLGKRPKSGN